jgi:hypothetical protein
MPLRIAVPPRFQDGTIRTRHRENGVRPGELQ